MDYWTYNKLKAKIFNEHDLAEESFISPQELLDYVNDAIDIAESIIIPLYEDYYLTCTEWSPIAAVNSLPSDIWANKIRKVEVRSSLTSNPYTTQVYKNRQLRNETMLYNIYNKSNEKPTLVFQNLGDNNQYRLHYTRNASRVILGTDGIDLPEVAIQFIAQYVKVKVFEKEKDPMLNNAKSDLAGIKDLMVDSLENIVDDGSEILETDFTFYDDFDDTTRF